MTSTKDEIREWIADLDVAHLRDIALYSWDSGHEVEIYRLAASDATAMAFHFDAIARAHASKFTGPQQFQLAAFFDTQERPSKLPFAVPGRLRFDLASNMLDRDQELVRATAVCPKCRVICGSPFDPNVMRILSALGLVAPDGLPLCPGVYFAQEDFPVGHGNVKIGEAEVIRSRVYGNQTGNPRALSLIRFEIIADKAARVAREAELHERFAHLRAGITGGKEWFRFDLSLLT